MSNDKNKMAYDHVPKTPAPIGNKHAPKTPPSPPPCNSQRGGNSKK
ncbi:MAG: hypothetical protein J6572_11065 [Gilliamella sp.]|nr:hypothetical protein [Gilliamella sp.]